MDDVIIIGAGASGMSAAIAAAQGGARVLVLEKMKKPGRKLLLTGNGQCNLSNLDPALCRAYRSSGGDCLERLADSVFRALPVSSFLKRLAENGLPVTDRNGYVYPVSHEASSVLRYLQRRMDACGVRTRFGTPVTGLEKTEKGYWNVLTEGWTYTAKRVVIACGGASFPQTGSDGSGYVLAGQTGHTIAPVVPALTALQCRPREMGTLSGIRCPVTLTLRLQRDSTVFQSIHMDRSRLTVSGELQITDREISGIVVFQVSRYAALALRAGEKVFAEIDFYPHTGEKELLSLVTAMKRNTSGDEPPAAVFGGMHHEKLMTWLLTRCGLMKLPAVSSLGEAQMSALVNALKHTRLEITGCREIERAQVTAGGVSLREVNPETLESNLCHGLYFAGEVLDVDGPCGGYNLQWAFSSGFLAGRSAAGGD